MKISVVRREGGSYRDKPIYTLTVSTEDGQAVCVFIPWSEACRTIDAHGLSGYETLYTDGATEDRWDNFPPAGEPSPGTDAASA